MRRACSGAWAGMDQSRLQDGIIEDTISLSNDWTGDKQREDQNAHKLRASEGGT